MSYLEGLKAAEIAEWLNIFTRMVENYRSLLFLRKRASDLFMYLFTLI
jgi:RNA polymerase sigma-70 factor (ECF subfamily)